VSALTPLHEHTLSALLERYDLGRLQAFWPAGGGVENSNYFVRLAGGGDPQEVVLTILEQQPASGDLLVPILDRCDEAGLPIAPILRNRDGEARERVEGKAALLAPRLLGRHVVNPTLRQCEAVGRFLARFHLATAQLTETAPAHPRDADWLEGRSRGVRASMPYADACLLTDAISAATNLLRRDDVRRLPRGIIHGDLFRDNALFTERGLTGVIDFHHASAGILLYDLAVAANDWCTDASGLLDRDRTMALLRAYHGIRRLAATELWFFALFALYTALAFWLSRLEVAIGDGRHVGRSTKNPDEFRRIVRQRLAHCLYLDPRLFE
jgi:homoserine kinase type II